MDERLIEIVSRWRDDAYTFVVECLGAQPTPQQKEALDAFSASGARVSITSGHGTGKSTLFCWLIYWALCCFYDVKVAVTAPTAHQLSDILWTELGKWKTHMLEPWKSDIVIKADKASVAGGIGFAVARTSRKESPEALQGFHAKNMMFLVDEASGIPEAIFEAARGSLSTPGARVLMAANPTRLSGYFYNSHHRNRDLWTRFRFSCLESSNVDPEYPKQIAEEYGEDSDMYRVRVLGEFPHASVTQFIPADAVEAATGKHLRPEMYDFAPKVLGVDVAMFGGDRSVIFLRQGLYSDVVYQARGVLPEELAGHAARLYDELGADAMIVDATGVGEAVMSALRIVHRQPIPFYAAGRSLLPNCANRRTEVWLKMRDWLMAGGALPDVPDLRDDLLGPEYQFTSKNLYQLERKADMKKRGLASPDLADALAVTFAADVVKRVDLTAAANIIQAHTTGRKYDPLWRTKR